MKTNILSILGGVGVFLIALLSPCCFPLLATVLLTFTGYSIPALGVYGSYILFGGIAITGVGLFLNYKKHRNKLPGSIFIGAVVSFIAGRYISTFFNTLGFFILLASIIVDIIQKRAHACDCNSKGCKSSKEKTISLESTLKCPHCSHIWTETMPDDTCNWMGECPHCKQILKTQIGDCCIYCSYGDTPCPSKQ